MALTGISKVIKQELREMADKHILKGAEKVITGIIAATGNKGPRYLLSDFPEREFLRMNSNSYLGLSLDPRVVSAEEKATHVFGTGPGAVRFISGTYQPHIDLEAGLAQFHNRESSMIFSAAYAAVMGVLPALVTPKTIIITDALNHNCIINAVRLANPAGKMIYRHLDMDDLELKLKISIGMAQRIIVITDGIFSMRGDHAPLDEINILCARYENFFPQGIITVIDDSHGVGVFGETGRGVEEYTQTQTDLLIGTLGKGFGVNGGYVVSSQLIVDYLRQKSPFYVYSNPITASEAAAAHRALQIVAGLEGAKLLARLRHLTLSLEQGLVKLGFEILPSTHPIVPLMIRDTNKTAALVNYLLEHDILVTGLNYPVVPKGDEE
ncbi:MAG: aminotransferase class I/II-fold pyridoxal phosphate-dependent enzyme, partial [Desulfobulbaceae bacterium]|nr:aminotransferase class I/II-fold pyridoxal phosphate-dependent enzyme [Desulfobulbaceae bacterium]